MNDLNFVQSLLSARQAKNQEEFVRVLKTEGHYERLLDIALRGCSAGEIKAPRPAKRQKQDNSQQDYPSIPSWVPDALWGAYVEMRKKIKAPLTPHAMGLCIKKLDKMRSEGMDPSSVLEQSIERSYRGLFPVRKNEETFQFTSQASNVAAFVPAHKLLGRLEMYFGLNPDQPAGTWLASWGDISSVPDAVFAEFDRLHPGIRKPIVIHDCR